MGGPHRIQPHVPRGPLPAGHCRRRCSVLSSATSCGASKTNSSEPPSTSNELHRCFHRWRTRKPRSVCPRSGGQQTGVAVPVGPAERFGHGTAPDTDGPGLRWCNRLAGKSQPIFLLLPSDSAAPFQRSQPLQRTPSICTHPTGWAWSVANVVANIPCIAAGTIVWMNSPAN